MTFKTKFWFIFYAYITEATAITNLTPGFTILLAIIFRYVWQVIINQQSIQQLNYYIYMYITRSIIIILFAE